MSKQKGLYHQDGRLIKDGDFKEDDEGNIPLIEIEPPKGKSKKRKYFTVAEW